MPPSARALALEDRVIDVKDPEIAAAVAQVFPGRKNIFPLNQQELSFELKDVGAAYAAAFKRVMCTELPGPFLHFKDTDVEISETSEPFMISSFLVLHISNVPLRHGLQREEYQGVTMHLAIANTTAEVRKVFTGDLVFQKDGKPYKPAAPFFNPTIQIAFVNPGKTLKIDNIRIEETTGRMFAAAQNAVRGRAIPLDLEEMPRERTHAGLQDDAQRSGYLMKRDGRVTLPRHFRVQVTIPAALRGSAAARRLPCRACDSMMSRLRSIDTIVKRAREAADESGEAGVSAAAMHDAESSYWMARLGTGEREGTSVGTLYLRGETESTTQMLKEALVETPEVTYVGAARKVEANAIQLAVNLRGEPDDLSALMLSAVDSCLTTLAKLRTDLKKM